MSQQPLPTSFSKDRIKILLLEGIHDSAAEAFHANGYTSVRRLEDAL